MLRDVLPKEYQNQSLQLFEFWGAGQSFLRY
jgi:hypothetical protein